MGNRFFLLSTICLLIVVISICWDYSLSSLLLFAYIFEGYRHFLLYLTGILAFLTLLLIIWDTVAKYQAYQKEVLYGEG